MNRIDQAFADKKDRLLNIYFTAGFPDLDDTVRVAQELEKAGANILEIGLPYSDPIADGPTIQESSNVAIENGMTLKVLFEQLKELRSKVSIPVILMGYLNPIIQFGVEKFCTACNEVGIDGLILPDLPMYEYETIYKPDFEKNGLYNIFLITPQTTKERILKIDELSSGFIYMVSSASITGAKSEITPEQIEYFDSINAMNLTNKRLIGFGISNQSTFNAACQYASGAIVGSAFIKQLSKDSSTSGIHSFIHQILGK